MMNSNSEKEVTPVLIHDPCGCAFRLPPYLPRDVFTFSSMETTAALGGTFTGRGLSTAVTLASTSYFTAEVDMKIRKIVDGSVSVDG